MNQSQLKYARMRAEALLKQKEVELTEKYTTPAKSLTDQEKIDAVLSGQFTIRTDKGWWYTRIDFGEQMKTIDIDKRDPELKKLRESFTKLMDEMILGDDDLALEMLREFEKL